jgi:hypothetical protein
VREERGVTAFGGQSVVQPSWTVVAPTALQGETVVVVRQREHLDDACAANPGAVVYLDVELCELLHHSPNLIRAAHRAKKSLNVLIIPRASALGEWCESRVAIPAEQLVGLDEENHSHE